MTEKTFTSEFRKEFKTKSVVTDCIMVALSAIVTAAVACKKNK